MAGKKGSKTSKTDHVLNLLAGVHTPEGQNPSEPLPAENTAPAAGAIAASQPSFPSPASHVPILEVARTNHEALASTIHDALEDALQEELAAEDTFHDHDPQPEPAAAISEPAPGIPPSQAPEEADAALQDGAALPPPPAGTGADAEAGELPDGSVPLNVMEALVEDKLPRYVRMFHLCSCPRCLADAKALALSRLPPKYLVLPRSARAPMLGLYRAKYDFELTTQIVYACKVVMESPRHSLPGQTESTGGQSGS